MNSAGKKRPPKYAPGISQNLQDVLDTIPDNRQVGVSDVKALLMEFLEAQRDEESKPSRLELEALRTLATVVTNEEASDNSNDVLLLLTGGAPIRQIEAAPPAEDDEEEADADAHAE